MNPWYPRGVRSLPIIAAALCAAASLSLISTPAKADASAWMFVGGGATGYKMGDGSSLGFHGSLAFDVGAGTTPDAPFIFGGYFHLQPIFAGSGTDIAVLARVATHGFQAGDFGLALDAGGYARFWSIQSYGFTGGLALGAPLGFELHLTSDIGTHQAQSFGAIAGVDFLRLTVYRQSMLDHWYNPSPAQQNRKTGSIPKHLRGLALFLY